MDIKDLYALLGVPATADAAELARAYRRRGAECAAADRRGARSRRAFRVARSGRGERA